MRRREISYGFSEPQTFRTQEAVWRGVGIGGKETEVGNLPEPTVRLFRCHPITLPFVSPQGTEQERAKALYHFGLLCGEVCDWLAAVTGGEARTVKSILSCGTDLYCDAFYYY